MSEEKSVITFEALLKACIPVLIAVVGVLWSEIKDIRDRQVNYVTQEQLLETERRINDSVAKQIGPIDKKLDILIDREMRQLQ